MGEAKTKLTIDAGVQGGAAAASELTRVADANRDVAQSIDATAAASQAAQAIAEELAEKQARLSRELAQVAAEAAAVEERKLHQVLRDQAAAAEAAAAAQRSLAREMALVRLEADAAAERELKEGLAAEARAAENAVVMQQRLGRELAIVAQEAAALESAKAQEDLAESLRLQAEAAEQARPALEALSEAQQRLAQLKAIQSQGLEGRSVGEVHAFNDAIAQQENLIRSLGGEQQGLNTRTQDWVGILNRLNPRLGEMALAIVRVSRLVNDFGVSGADLKGILEAATKSALDNAAAIARIGLAGGGAFAIYQIVAALGREQEARDRVTESIRKQAEAENDLERKRRDHQASLEKQFDQRREGGVDNEQAKSAQQLAARIKSKFKDLDDSDINTAVAGLFGTGASEDEIVRAAFGVRGVAGRKLEFGEKQSAESRLARARGFEGKPGVTGATDTAIHREGVQAGAVAGGTAAIKESKSTGGSSINIEDFIRELPGKAFQGVDIAKVAEIVKALGDGDLGKNLFRDALALSLDFISAAIPRSDPNKNQNLVDRFSVERPGFINLQTQERILSREGVKDATPDLIRLAEFVLQRLQKIEDNTAKVGGNNYFTGPVSVQGSGPVNNGQTHAGRIGE